MDASMMRHLAQGQDAYLARMEDTKPKPSAEQLDALVDLMKKDAKPNAEKTWISQSLFEADKIINGARQDTYGAPEDSFGLISQYWGIYLRHRPKDRALDSFDVAVMMTLFKLARIQGQAWHRDNAIDAIGYLAILADRIKGGE